MIHLLEHGLLEIHWKITAPTDNPGRCCVYSLLLLLRSGKIKTIQVHNLVPGCNEVVQEFFL